MKKYLFISLFVVFVVSNLLYASPIDSLKNILKEAKGDLKVKTLNELFRAYMNSDPVKAIGYTREALTLATEIDDKKGMAVSYNNLGMAYRSQGALDKSLEYYLISLRIYDKLKSKDGIATTKSNIGIIYSMKKDYGQAMKYFEEAHAQFTELGDQTKMIFSMNNLGNLHSDLQLFDQALKYYSQALQLSQKSRKIYSNIQNNIGNIYFRQGNYQQAVGYYEKALVVARKEENQLTILNLLANLGEVYARAGQGLKAQSYLDSALLLSGQLQVFVYEPNILKSMSYNYAKQNKMKEAYETMVRYDGMKEKIFGEESSRKITQMEIALDLQEREKELEALKNKEELSRMELRHTQLAITSIVLGIIVIVWFMNLYLSKRKNKK
ncbi:MAG: tetratricopeptide repeat protein [Cyclobacteriaceae bacterium]|nr:tetratricopeptide repeat protein [Cyclobacteriaceae bacterium]